MIVGFWLWFWSSFITYFLFCAFVWQPCVSSVSLMVSLVSTALYLTCLFEGIWMAWKKNEWKREREKKKNLFSVSVFLPLLSHLHPTTPNTRHTCIELSEEKIKTHDSSLNFQIPMDQIADQYSVDLVSEIKR